MFEMLDGLGTELGGSAFLIVIGKIILEYIKEKRSKKEAVAVADKSEKVNNRNNPEEITMSRKRMNGKSSVDFMLFTLNQHTEEIGMIRRNVSDLREKVGEIKGQLSQLNRK